MHDPLPRRNIELKARLVSLAAARKAALDLGAIPQGILVQSDTYFVCQHGRLKLRETAGAESQLVWYARTDEAAAKESQYLLTAVADPLALRQTLARAMGILVVVRKQRELLLLANVRIHLDRVEELGDFLEFEAVLGGSDDEGISRERLERLTRGLGVQETDLLCRSYSDMLLADRGQFDPRAG